MAKKGAAFHDPIVAPLPDISGDGIQSISIGREGINRASTGVPVFAGIGGREITLPNIAQMVAIGSKVVAPRIKHLSKSTPCCKLPFSFGW